MEMIFVWIFLVVIFGDLEATASFTGPSNVATVAGNQVFFNCSTSSPSRLRWSMRRIDHSGDPQILTRENKVLPNFESQYSVEANNGQLNLGIKKANSSHAGKYICLELETSNTASAELTVLDAEPVCNIIRDPLAIQCKASYNGRITPEFELKPKTTKDDSHGHLTRQLTLGTDVLRSLNLSCVASFSGTSTKNANLFPENENGVKGTVARNTPSLVSTTECGSLSQTTSIAGVHYFELFVFAITSFVVYCLNF